MGYANYMVKHKLSVQRKPNPDDFTSFGGKERLNIPFLRGSYFDAVELLLVAEVFTYFKMAKNDLTYQEATQSIYRGMEPTSFHVHILGIVS